MSKIKTHNSGNGRHYIFGVEPFPEERYILWNIVSSDKDNVIRASNDWKLQKFPKIRAELDFALLPT